MLCIATSYRGRRALPNINSRCLRDWCHQQRRGCCALYRRPSRCGNIECRVAVDARAFRIRVWIKGAGGLPTFPLHDVFVTPGHFSSRERLCSRDLEQCFVRVFASMRRFVTISPVSRSISCHSRMMGPFGSSDEDRWIEDAEPFDIDTAVATKADLAVCIPCAGKYLLRRRRSHSWRQFRCRSLPSRCEESNRFLRSRRL